VLILNNDAVILPLQSGFQETYAIFKLILVPPEKGNVGPVGHTSVVDAKLYLIFGCQHVLHDAIKLPTLWPEKVCLQRCKISRLCTPGHRSNGPPCLCGHVEYAESQQKLQQD
jgi:hypothetical protein